MNAYKLLILFSLVVALALAGCAGPAISETVEQVCIAKLEKEAAIKAAEDVLGRMHFTIEKSDAELGIIKTRPLRAGQFFEFWRKDNVGAYNSTEANLHTIRRTVELNISSKGEQLCIACNVKVQRLSLWEDQGSAAALKYDKFTGSQTRKNHLELQLRTGRKQWIDLGADEQLGSAILKQIEEQTSEL